jgi:hypothetical protein
MPSVSVLRGVGCVEDLPERERAVLRRRLAGETFEGIARAEGASRQRVAQLEQRALRRLACGAEKRTAGLTVAGLLATVRAGRTLDATASRLAVTELNDTGRALARRAADLTPREQAEQRLEQLADDLLAEAEAGPLTAARRRWYADRAAQLAG